MCKTKNVVAFGTLREDLLLQYDFTTPIGGDEIKIGDYKSVVGGSVFNTCTFLSDYYHAIDITLFSLNYVVLTDGMLQFCQKYHNYNINYAETAIDSRPLSIIGIKEDGDKNIISCDKAIDGSEVIDLLSKKIEDFHLLYTSFYEVNTANYMSIVQLFADYMKIKKTVMIDLCPLLSLLSGEMLTKILSSVTVLSGNESEYQLLLRILELEDIENILKIFRNISLLWIKKGEKGGAVITRKNEKNINSYHKYESVITTNIKAKNTTGCGDAFNAVVICGLVNGWELQHIIDEAVNVGKKIALGGFSWIGE
ncbi:MAG: carbohydrate kinase family protein [Dorea sp.]|nr:carbohydrate kinase family protein [Dorea sp.]